MFSADAALSPQLGVRLSANKHTFLVSETVSITLALFNHTSEPLTLHFRSAQRYDFLLQDESGKVLWRWSEGKMFAQVLGRVVIGPENPEVRYSQNYAGELAPGHYTIRGKLTDQDSFASASLAITVAPKPN